jgi:thiamine kinase
MSARGPEQLLAEWQALGLPFAARPELVRALPGGRTNRSYLIEAAGERYVLRMDAAAGAALGIDRHREHRIVAAAAKAGLAPALVQADAERGYLLLAYAEGEHAEPACLSTARREALLTAAAQIAGLDVEVQASDYSQLVALLRDDCDVDAKVGSELEQRIRLLQQHCARGICHHDLVPGNVIFSANTVLLIDWEYAGLGLPILDLATLSAAWQLPTAMLCEVTQTDTALLVEARAVHDTLCRLWEKRVSIL